MTICPTLDQMSREVEVGSKLQAEEESDEHSLAS